THDLREGLRVFPELRCGLLRRGTRCRTAGQSVAHLRRKQNKTALPRLAANLLNGLHLQPTIDTTVEFGLPIAPRLDWRMRRFAQVHRQPMIHDIRSGWLAALATAMALLVPTLSPSVETAGRNKLDRDLRQKVRAAQTSGSEQEHVRV